MNKKNIIIVFLLLVSLQTIIAQKSNYFSENCWRVYSWAGWKTQEVTPQTHPLIKGAPLILKWNQVEPKAGEFQFDKELKAKLELAEKYNYYTFLMIWVAPNAPKWLYENGVPELEMTKTVNPLGQPRNETFQYYLDEKYKMYYHRMLTELGKYVQSLPVNLRKRLLYIQSAEGSTGDGDPYKGNPLDLKYDITKEQWGDFRIKAWDVMKKSLTNAKGELVTPILVNYDANGDKENNWLLNNLPVIGLKNGMFSHGYHISETKSRLNSWKSVHEKAAQKGIEMFSRGEQDGEWKVYGWSTKNTPQAFYWSGIFATHCGLSMWNVPADAAAGLKHQDGINFFNKYAGKMNPSTSNVAFCALRKGLDAEDILNYPENVYGKCDRKNKERYLKIAEAFSKYGAYQGDPEKAVGGGMVNRKRNDYNDVGWGITDSNYSRFIEQINPETTSDGWWHIGPQESVYGRFARSIKLNNGKGGLYFDVNDDFARTAKTIQLRIVWLDQGTAQWSVLYNSKKNANEKVFTVNNTNTGKWMEKTVQLKDLQFSNKGKLNSDISFYSESKETTIFHLIELLKTNK